MIKSNATQTLLENMEEINWVDSMKGYVEYSAENDPTFYSWLLGEDVEDYGSAMTEEHKEEYNEFLQSL